MFVCNYNIQTGLIMPYKVNINTDTINKQCSDVKIQQNCQKHVNSFNLEIILWTAISLTRELFPVNCCNITVLLKNQKTKNETTKPNKNQTAASYYICTDHETMALH